MLSRPALEAMTIPPSRAITLLNSARPTTRALVAGF